MSLERLYQQRFTPEDLKLKYRIWREIVTYALQPRIPAEATILDVGCGRGEFINQVKAAKKVGVDLNPENREALDEDIEYHCCLAGGLGFLEAGRFDLVFMSNLLEHLQNEEAVDELLEGAYRVLKPGGKILLMGPNIRLIPGAYWDFWDHRVAISDKSMCEALRAVDFTVTESVARFLPYTTKCALPAAPLLVRLYLWMRPMWFFFGQQFLVTGQKPLA